MHRIKKRIPRLVFIAQDLQKEYAMVNYNHYQTFYYVAETGNITAAAKLMFLSQSTVSRAIQELERDLGCTLLFRSKKGTTLSEQGQMLYTSVKKAVEIITEAENKFSRSKKLNTSFLHISVSEFTLRYFLSPYLAKLEKVFPDIHISFLFGAAEKIVEKLNSGQIDIAVLASPFLDLSSDIKVEPLTAFRSVVITSPARMHLLHRPIDFTELEHEPFIGMNEGSVSNKYIRQIFADYSMNYSPKYIVSSGLAILSMVENNLGVGIIPQFYAADSIMTGRVAEITLARALPMRQICALTSQTFPVNTARDAFMKQILCG